MPVTQSPPPAPAKPHALSHIEAEVTEYALEAWGWSEDKVKQLLAYVAKKLQSKPTPSTTSTVASGK